MCVQKKNKTSGFFWTNVFLICTFAIMSMKSTRVDTRPPVTWPLINLCASQVKPTEQSVYFLFIKKCLVQCYGQSGKDIRISPPSYRCVNSLLLLYQFNFWMCILCVFNKKSKEKKNSQWRQLEDVHDCWITERRVWKVKELSQDHWWLHFKNKQTNTRWLCWHCILNKKYLPNTDCTSSMSCHASAAMQVSTFSQFLFLSSSLHNIFRSAQALLFCATVKWAP